MQRATQHLLMHMLPMAHAARACRASNNSSLLFARCMHVLHSPLEYASYRSTGRRAGRVGFVPTMGALHDGHLALVRLAKKHSDVVVASVFVNPTQFSAGEDLDKYPRQLEQDLSKLRALDIDSVFVPSVENMYSKHFCCFVEPHGFEQTAEGHARADFFRGVATVVTKLLNVVRPDVAFFGQKDIAQCVLIRRLVEDLNMDTRIVICETVRESDGLAMSSRNAYLQPNERAAAPILFQALHSAQRLFDKNMNGQVTKKDVVASVESVLAKEPLIKHVEYVSMASLDTMQELDSFQPGNEMVAISSAVRCGSVRLIDNYILGTEKQKKELMVSPEQ